MIHHVIRQLRFISASEGGVGASLAEAVEVGRGGWDGEDGGTEVGTGLHGYLA